MAKEHNKIFSSISAQLYMFSVQPIQTVKLNKPAAGHYAIKMLYAAQSYDAPHSIRPAK